MQPDENRIRERAYQIWQQEGCPDGRDHIHWQMAAEQIASEEAGNGGREAERPGARGGSGPMSDTAPPATPPAAAAETRKPRATARSATRRSPQR